VTLPGVRPESIRYRLRNHLSERGEDIASGLQRYAAERFRYRLGRSPYRERFVLKGARLFGERCRSRPEQVAPDLASRWRTQALFAEV